MDSAQKWNLGIKIWFVSYTTLIILIEKKSLYFDCRLQNHVVYFIFPSNF